MNLNRSTRKAMSLATLVVLSALSVSACVQTLGGDYYYDDTYYPEQVVVKQTTPVIHRIDVYETRPTVIVTRPKPFVRHHVKYYRPSQEILTINPGRHQQQHVIIKNQSRLNAPSARVIKDYRATDTLPSRTSPTVRTQNNYETHEVLPSSRTAVKQPKKIVIESSSDAP